MVAVEEGRMGVRWGQFPFRKRQGFCGWLVGGPCSSVNAPSVTELTLRNGGDGDFRVLHISPPQKMFLKIHPQGDARVAQWVKPPASARFGLRIPGS